MDEVLKKLLESEILTDDNRQAITEAFLAEIAAVKASAREEAIKEAKLEYAKQFTEEKALLVEALDTKLQTLLAEELAELKEDIERFRDLEAEHAVKLVEHKEQLGVQLKADLAKLVEALDVFLEERLSEEVKELKESIDEVKKIKYAKDLFESIEKSFKDKFFDDNKINEKLDENKKELEQKDKLLKESTDQLNKLVREKTMNEVLSTLTGRPREIMEAILVSYPTNKLQEAYNSYIGRVLNDSITKSEQDNGSKPSVLAENVNNTNTEEKNVVKTGNLNESEGTLSIPKELNPEIVRLQKVAGIVSKK